MKIILLSLLLGSALFQNTLAAADAPQELPAGLVVGKYKGVYKEEAEKAEEEGISGFVRTTILPFQNCEFFLESWLSGEPLPRLPSGGWYNLSIKTQGPFREGDKLSFFIEKVNRSVFSRDGEVGYPVDRHFVNHLQLEGSSFVLKKPFKFSADDLRYVSFEFNTSNPQKELTFTIDILCLKDGNW